MQEGFLAVWRNAAKFEAERAKPSTWILTLVHRRAVDLVRREQRRRGEPLESAPMAAGEETSEQAELRERRRRVQAALGQLPELERQSLELAYYGGLTPVAARRAAPNPDRHRQKPYVLGPETAPGPSGEDA